MYQDQILRFIGATREWEQDILEKPQYFQLDKLPGNPKDCVIFQRACNIDEMESEDDEAYIFSTPDSLIRAKFNRFQTRIIFSKFSLKFTNERIDFIIKMAWNYPKVAINKLTSEYEPYNDKQTSPIPPVIASGSPPLRIVYIDE